MRGITHMGKTYDNEAFFTAYAGMTRSRKGLAGAGEWHQLEKLFPDVSGKDVLDLGCGYGWHCRYAADRGAARVLGLDQSRRMIDEAERRNPHPAVTYQVGELEEYGYPEETWDLVVSNLVLHYIADLDGIYQKVYRTLKEGGRFLFNIEHPVYTAAPGQTWITGAEGERLCWPVDRYFYPGPRTTDFLGFEMEKQHHTLTQILQGLLDAGFVLKAVEEVTPPEEMLERPGMSDELRRPMMLLVSAEKPKK